MGLKQKSRKKIAFDPPPHGRGLLGEEVKKSVGVRPVISQSPARRISFQSLGAHQLFWRPSLSSPSNP